MQYYSDQLSDFIQNNGLFESKDEGSLNKSKARVISHAIEELLKPNWEKSRINNQLQEDSEAAIVDMVAKAVTNVLEDSLGYNCEQEVRGVIEEKLKEWHTNYKNHF